MNESKCHNHNLAGVVQWNDKRENWQKKAISPFVSHKRIDHIHVSNSLSFDGCKLWRNPAGVRLCFLCVLFDSRNIVFMSFFRAKERKRTKHNKLISHGEKIIYFLQYWPLSLIFMLFSSQLHTYEGIYLPVLNRTILPNGCWVVKSEWNISHLVALDVCHICTLVSEWNPCSAKKNSSKSQTPFNIFFSGNPKIHLWQKP